MNSKIRATRRRNALANICGSNRTKEAGQISRCALRVGRDELASGQKIERHPQCSELLLNGRFGTQKILNPGSQQRNGRTEVSSRPMSGAPIKKLPASPSVGSPSVPVSDRRSEKVNVGFSDFGTSGSYQLRDPRLRRRA